MATDYPGTGVDSFARPVSGVDSQDSPDSATLANNHSDAIEALQTKVGPGTGTPTAGAVLKGASTVGDSEWSDEVPVGDGTLAVGDLLLVKSLSPLVVEGVEDGTYATALTRLWIPANRFSVGGGSPALTVVNSTWSVFGMDAGNSEHVVTVFDVPDGWATYDIELWWTNLGAGSGDVRFITYAAAAVGDGDTLAAHSQQAAQALTAPAQNVVEVSAAGADVACTPGELHEVTVLRQGPNAGDTLANDAGFLGLMLRKAS